METSNNVTPPEKTIQDLFQWFGKIASDYSSKLNENTSENIEILTKDIKKLYTKVENMMVQGQDSLKINAQEMRKKTVEELYQTIKVNLICHRDSCKCIHTTPCTSVPIIEEVVKLLTDEGFEAKYVINIDDTCSSTTFTIQW